MDRFVLIKVIMLFNPADAWQHVHQFDKSFAEYLKTIGLQAQEVQTAGGSSGEKILLIKKAEPLLEMPKQTDEVGPKEALNKMISPKGEKKGKMLWSKGYLKK